MPSSIFYYYFLIIYLYLFAKSNNSIADAKLIAYFNDTSLTYPTSDYFLHKQSYYHYFGRGFVWPWMHTDNCTLVDTSQIYAKTEDKLTKQLILINNLTITVNKRESISAGCRTIAQIGLQANKIYDQLSKRRLAKPAKLFIIVDYYADDADDPIWGHDELMYRTPDPRNIPEGPPQIDAALLTAHNNSTNQLLFSTSSLFYFNIKQEPGPWNKVYLSGGFITFKWLCFVLVLVALLYACARLIAMIRLKTCPKDLRMLAFVLAFTTAIVYMVYITTHLLSRNGSITRTCLNLLIPVTMDVILLYCSFYEKMTLSKIFIIFIRIFVFIHFAIIVTDSTIILLIITDNATSEVTMRRSKIISILRLISNPILLIIFGILVIWFARITYRLRKYSEACFRFVQLLLLSSIQFISYLVLLIVAAIKRYQSNANTNASYKERVLGDVEKYLFLAINIASLLMVLGIRWPQMEKQRDKTYCAPLDGEFTNISGQCSLATVIDPADDLNRHV